MMYYIERSDEEINDLLNRCAEQVDQGGSKYFGMTFEQGIIEAIDWITGNQKEDPLGEDFLGDDE